MPDETVLRERLSQAESALHLLLIGESEIEVEYEGSRTKMKPADEPRLRRYIQSLKRQLGEGGGSASRKVIF
ncbi:MAG: gpW family head-tail joining protein [Pelagimonas sp.]|uniref:gpW family head-tail joining protein n=1 Tax=Pelagimonas sp. TaxID=2073170 RepID=UPI003D6C37A9